MKINMLDLFSGIGGFTRGLSQAGFEINEHFNSEIDRNASAIFNYHYRNTTNVGSIEHFRNWKLPKIDAITFGSPCQDLSLAGSRLGIEGERSGLIRNAIECVRKFRPDFFIWENVEGTFSSNNGADFWTIIKEFTDLGYDRLEWQLLNTSWFLPQNRSRIYLVGYHSSGCTGSVFPIEQTNTRFDERKKRATVARCLQSPGKSGGHHSGMTLIRQSSRGFNNGGDHDVSPTITGSRFEQNNHVVISDVEHRRVRSILTAHTKQNGRHLKDEGEPTFTLKQNNEQAVVLDTMYAMGPGKKGRSTIQTRPPEVGTEQESVRRLMEIEAEELQGFPADWTKYGLFDGVVKEIAATNRYKCIGNAVTVDVVEAVASSFLKMRIV